MNIKNLKYETTKKIQYYQDKIDDLNTCFFMDFCTESMEEGIRRDLKKAEKEKQYFEEILTQLKELEDLKNDRDENKKNNSNK